MSARWNTADPVSVFREWLTWLDSPDGLAWRREANQDKEPDDYDLLATIPTPPRGSSLFLLGDLRALVEEVDRLRNVLRG